MVKTDDKSSFSKKGRHKIPGHFTKSHVNRLVHILKGDEAPSEQEKRHEQARHTAERSTIPSQDDAAAKPSLNANTALTPSAHKTHDDVATGEGLSEAMSLDAIRDWKRP